MKELQAKGKKGILKDAKIQIFYDFQPRDRVSIDDELVVDRDEFFNVLDKASQPIKDKPKTNKESQ